MEQKELYEDMVQLVNAFREATETTGGGKIECAYAPDDTSTGLDYKVSVFLPNGEVLTSRGLTMIAALQQTRCMLANRCSEVSAHFADKARRLRDVIRGW